MEKNIDRLGIIAGNGDLPLLILEECKKKNITPFIAIMKDFADVEKYKNFQNITIGFGDVGKTIAFFKKNNVKNLVFAGGVKKPNIKTIFPDFKGFFLLLKLLKNKVFGDDTILQTTIQFLEKQGFNVMSVEEILSDIKIKEGIVGNVKWPNNDYIYDINLGVKVLKQMGDLDIGQSVVIQNGIVIGIECIEGTEKLIERCGQLKYTTGRKPILVKIKKTTQTKKIDLPSIGENTIDQIKNAGFAGIAFDCNSGLVINKQTVIEKANENKIFIYGINVDKF